MAKNKPLLTVRKKWRIEMISRNSKFYRQGATDYYYGKPCEPSIKIGLQRVLLVKPEEIAAYKLGYEEETERKDWGRD